MNWLTKLERKFGRYCIPNLIALLVGGQIVVYAVELFVNRYITYFLALTGRPSFRGRSGGWSPSCSCRSVRAIS